MNQQEQHEKGFQIIEEYHRQKSGQKIYKLRFFMTGIMMKAEQKLKAKFGVLTPNPSPVPSNQQLVDEQIGSLDDELDKYGKSSLIAQQKFEKKINPTQIQVPNRRLSNVKIFQDFKNRGKFHNLKYHFSRAKHCLTAIIDQEYYLKKLKAQQSSILQVVNSFFKTWTDQHLNMIQMFMKYAKQFSGNNIIKFDFISIDLISITFEITYSSSSKSTDKVMAEFKKFRFRYSLFEFRQNPFFEQKATEQIISFVELHSNHNQNVYDQQFYASMRLGFIDDINSNSNDLWRRVITRFWVFFQIHSLNRGIADFQDFNKKALGRVFFHSVRMKKFQLIFPFPLLNKSLINQQKQITLYFTFYLDDKLITQNQYGIQFRMQVNLTEHTNFLNFQQKSQLLSRLKKQESFMISERQPPLKSNQLFQFWMNLKFDDKISKAFSKFQTIVSFFLDKIAFSEHKSNLMHREKNQQIQSQKIIQLFSQPVLYTQVQSQYNHTHCLIIELKHTYRLAVQQKNQIKYVDDIRLHQLIKQKKKKNTKQQRDQGTERTQLLLSDEVQLYINHLIKSEPLRECYFKIVKYIESVVRVLFSPFKESNSLIRYQKKWPVFNSIISNIIKYLQHSNNYPRRSDVFIYSEGHPLFIRKKNENDLIAEITFNIKDLKIFWTKRLPEGYIIIRLFDDRIEIVKDLSSTFTIKTKDPNIDKFSNEFMQQIKNILNKNFATIQSMMV